MKKDKALVLALAIFFLLAIPFISSVPYLDRIAYNLQYSLIVKKSRI